MERGRERERKREQGDSRPHISMSKKNFQTHTLVLCFSYLALAWYEWLKNATSEIEREGENDKKRDNLIIKVHVFVDKWMVNFQFHNKKLGGDQNPGLEGNLIKNV
jgi:hypothetical protein